MAEGKTRPDYGIDAPGVIRNLTIAGVLALSLAIASRITLLPGAIVIPAGKDATIRIPIFHRLDSRLAAIACTLATLGALSPHVTLARKDP
jgi:hypothetical protein